MDKNVKEIFTKSKKTRETEKKAKKRFLAANATNATNSSNSTDANGFYKPSAKELEKEKNMTTRDVMAEVETFEATTFAGMCQPCLKGCKECAKGFFLKDNGDCVKGCDSSTEDAVVN